MNFFSSFSVDSFHLFAFALDHILSFDFCTFYVVSFVQNKKRLNWIRFVNDDLLLMINLVRGKINFIYFHWTNLPVRINLFVFHIECCGNKYFFFSLQIENICDEKPVQKTRIQKQKKWFSFNKHSFSVGSRTKFIHSFIRLLVSIHYAHNSWHYKRRVGHWKMAQPNRYYE